MSRQRLLSFVVIACLSFAAGQLHKSAAQENERPDPLLVNARARRLAARRAFEGLRERQALEPEHVSWDSLYAWSVRWLEADRDAARTKEERLAAFDAYLKRTEAAKESRATAVRNAQAAPYELEIAEFFRLEAEGWLIAEKAR